MLSVAWRILHWFLRLPFKFWGLEEEEVPCPLCEEPLHFKRGKLTEPLFCPKCGYRAGDTFPYW